MENIEKSLPDWAFQMNCAVTVCDADGVVVYMNEKGTRNIFETRRYAWAQSHSVS